jgi:hypothetical protein
MPACSGTIQKAGHTVSRFMEDLAMIRNTGLLLMLSMVMATGTCIAAEASSGNAATPAPSAAQPVQELEAVWVQGKRLAHRIEDAEDEFFPLYNKANRKDDFDIHCGYTYLSVDTMIMGRTCLATFLGQSYGPPVYWSACYGGFYGSSPYFYGYRRGYALYGGCADASGYEPPSPAFILMARKDDLRRNMLKVISSDPVLLQKAAHLGDLYRELESVQTRYRTIKGVKVRNGRVVKASRNVRKTTSPNTGPRSM